MTLNHFFKEKTGADTTRVLKKILEHPCTQFKSSALVQKKNRHPFLDIDFLI